MLKKFTERIPNKGKTEISGLALETAIHPGNKQKHSTVSIWRDTYFLSESKQAFNVSHESEREEEKLNHVILL